MRYVRTVYCASIGIALTKRRSPSQDRPRCGADAKDQARRTSDVEEL